MLCAISDPGGGGVQPLLFSEGSLKAIGGIRAAQPGEMASGAKSFDARAGSPLKPRHVPHHVKERRSPAAWSEGVCLIAVGERRASCPDIERVLWHCKFYN